MADHSTPLCQHGFGITGDTELLPYVQAMRTLSDEIMPHLLKNYLLPKVLVDVRTIILVSGLIIIIFRSPNVTACVLVAATMWWLWIRRKRFTVSSTLDDDQIQWFIDLLYERHEGLLNDENFVKLLISQAIDSISDAYKNNKWNNLVTVDLFTKLAIYFQLAIYFSDSDKDHKMRSTRDFRLRYFKAVSRLCGSRETILFLDSNTTCRCLAHLQVSAKATPPTCAARGCDQLLAGQVMYECLGCGLVHYCSRECYKRDWGCRHRSLCLMLKHNDKHCTCRGSVIKSRDMNFILRNTLRRCRLCGLYRNMIHDSGGKSRKLGS